MGCGDLAMSCYSAPGAPTAARVRPDSVFRPRGRHSEKPVQAYEIIEAMFPDLPKLELFCRSPRQGWAAWGNEA